MAQNQNKQRAKRMLAKKQERKNAQGAPKDKISFLKTKEDSIRMLMQLYQINEGIDALNSIIKKEFNDDCIDEYTIKLNDIFQKISIHVADIQNFDNDPNLLENMEKLIEAFYNLNKAAMDFKDLAKEYQPQLTKADEYRRQIVERQQTQTESENNTSENIIDGMISKQIEETEEAINQSEDTLSSEVKEEVNVNNNSQIEEPTIIKSKCINNNTNYDCDCDCEARDISLIEDKNILENVVSEIVEEAMNESKNESKNVIDETIKILKRNHKQSN